MPSIKQPRFKLASFLSLIALGAVALASDVRSATNEPALAASIDPLFEPGLARLKKATGIIEQPTESLSQQWAPDRQLLIGLSVVQRSNQLFRFVELTTVRPPATNAAGQPWSPRLETNRFGWSGTNAASRRTFEYVSALYPVRVRVFDPAGLMLKEGTTTLPWELLTNSLAETCRVCLSADPEGKSAQPPDGDEFMRPFLGGTLSLLTVFGEIQSTPALSDLCEKARCAVRLPGLWTMVKTVVGGSLVVSLEPRFKEISVVTPRFPEQDTKQYRFPLEMKNGKQILSNIEIIAGPSAGANVLLAGLRSIRAVHPTKADQVFTAQVLASGTAREESESKAATIPSEPQ